MTFDPEQITPLIPAVAAQLLNVVYERVALKGGNLDDENNFRKEAAVVFRQWEDLIFRLNETTDKIFEKGGHSFTELRVTPDDCPVSVTLSLLKIFVYVKGRSRNWTKC